MVNDMKLFTIGPTEMYETTKKVRQEKIPYFRNNEFSELMFETDAILKKLMGTSENSKAVYLTASGTAGLEATVDNLIRKEDSVLVVNGGTFGKRFAEICELKGIKYDVILLEDGEKLEWKHFEPYYKNEYRAVLVNLHETSTGQLYDIELFRRFCTGKDTLLIVDAISTFLCDPYEMDRDGIDVSIISTQKGLCVSPGMSIVVMNEKTVRNYLKSTDEIKSVYFDFNSYIDNMKRGQTPFTPAVGIVFEIHDMLRSVEQAGLETKLEEVRERAEAFRNSIVSEGISIPEFNCSNAITTVIFEKPAAKQIEKELISNLGYVINPCGGDKAEYRFRVSHVGALTIDDTVKLAEAIKELYEELK